MGKTKPEKNKNLNSAKQLHIIKNGLVKKDKNSKFKITPGGKASFNNSKTQKQNSPPQKNFQKGAGVNNNQNLSKNIVKNKQNFPNAQNKSTNKKINLNLKKLEETNDSNSDDSNSDIDEEMITKEAVGQIKSGEKFEDSEEESDTNILSILGKSLQDKSDEDDEDFYEIVENEDSSDDSEFKDDDASSDDSSDDFIFLDKKTGKNSVQKNVRAFENKHSKKNDDKDNKNKSDKKKLSQLIIKDDEDEENNEDDEDENESDEDDKEEKNKDDNKNCFHDDELVEAQFLKLLKRFEAKEMDKFKKYEDKSYEDTDEDDLDEEDLDKEDLDEEDLDEEDLDEEDLDEEDLDEEENEDSAPGLKALLGNSIADEDDDEDFNEEDEDDEDDDISDEDEDDEENDNVVKVDNDNVAKEKVAKASNNKDIKEHKQVKGRKEELSSEEKEEIDKRTIVIHNVPKDTGKADIKKVFGVFGPIETFRFRGIIPENPIMSKKVAYIKKLIHPNVRTVVVYIKYKSQESAQKALSMHGKVFRKNIIRVQTVQNVEKKEYDIKRAVFIGNLNFKIDENLMWRYFMHCGEIESVHLVNDKVTGRSRGFGYVYFKSESAAAIALQLDGLCIMERNIRVRPCLRPEQMGGKRASSNNDDGNPSKKFKNNLEKPVTRKAENEGNINKNKKIKKNKGKSEEQNSVSFQGQKANSKNKKKTNKFDKKKKRMAQKLTAKSTKPVKV